jgi:hypothetical protein
MLGSTTNAFAQAEGEPEPGSEKEAYAKEEMEEMEAKAEIAAADAASPEAPVSDKGEPPATDDGEPPAPVLKIETNCSDRIDNDNDSVVDCADADCFDKPVCQPKGQLESTDLLCSDWIDNDGDGQMDCDDMDCQGAGISACRGSWRGSESGLKGKTARKVQMEAPSLDEGVSVEELIGKLGDRDGERNDYMCSDGVDNDGDGRTDCADFGCRFDRTVSVCNPQPGFRFSLAGRVRQDYRIKDTRDRALNLNRWDTRFSLLQLRFLGPIGNIENSFFLVNMRVEKTPRVTFALAQLPIGTRGHFFNLTSGGGGLSSALITSTTKSLMLEPAYFAYSAFEQGNGASVEVGGPIDRGGVVNFRVFAAGGSGRFAGNVGGRFFSDDKTNYTWGAGGQVKINAIGYFNRFDSEMMYTPSPPLLAFVVGGKYDERAQERYPAWTARAVWKWGHFYANAESYTKRELAFGSWQASYLARLGVLLWPRHLAMGIDFGEFLASDYDNPPTDDEAGDEIERIRDERQARAVLHWYAYGPTGRISLLYTYRDVKQNKQFDKDGYKLQELSLAATYVF